ncbi:HAD-IIA family hydrolase [Leisingera sp. ANG-M7]|uniref:HAD-IIA family hydrolase n=1 Tax=Leisingera sp. ANG-M7 TaxID=1577902 RepID=UPI00057DB574|nr:HAD-IIA family hydrolase [Leisingera sp. ANG-M7]KIC34167.1 haloacid dehalogenase [Leisingera sp. ANG-M7]
MQTVHSVFARYEDLRARLPENRTTPGTTAIASLLELQDQAEAFVFDAFGVLNVGTEPIPGAAARLRQLRTAGCAIRILSNAASNGKAQTVEKFRALGIEIAPGEIITSRDAALKSLDNRLWGVIAVPDDRLEDIPAPALRLDRDAAAYDRADGFLFLSSADWNAGKQAMLSASLQQSPRPVVIANADLVAPRSGGLSLEPGFYGHQLADQGQTDVRFFGKPYPEVYALAAQTLADLRPDRFVMCGDTLHTDILGASAAGWQTVLVTRDGVLAGQEPQQFIAASGIWPDFWLPRI